MRGLVKIALAVSALAVSASFVEAGSRMSSGDLIQAISEDRLRTAPLQTGRSAAGGDGPAPRQHEGAPSDAREKEHNMLQGVDPAVTY